MRREEVGEVKKFGAWWLPAHEKHLQPWMEHPKNRDVVLNGRVAYQGRKQLAALEVSQLLPNGAAFRVAGDVDADELALREAVKRALRSTRRLVQLAVGHAHVLALRATSDDADEHSKLARGELVEQGRSRQRIESRRGT